MNVTVIGLGKLGLPLAVQFATMNHKVVGLDVNQETIDLINLGKEPFPGEFSLAEKLLNTVINGSFSSTTAYKEAISTAEVVVVVVPLMTAKDNTPDFQLIDCAISELAKYIRKGTLVSIETTLPVGTTNNRFKVAIEKATNYKCGEDFYLVFSPERVLTGRVFADLKRYPKIVGGVTKECGIKAKEFYESVIEFDERPDLMQANGVWLMSSSEEAEMVKLAETTYRDVNIALANEISKFTYRKGMDFSAIIEAANSQTFCHLHQPGISVGGHCIPVYPRLLMSTFDDADLVRTARSVNESMPEQYLNRIVKRIGPIKNSKILVLGLTYRPGVKESAYSGAFSLRDLINAAGADCYISDPYYSSAELEELGFNAWNDEQDIDFIILHTAHKEFEKFDFEQIIGLKGVVDGRNFFHKEKFENGRIKLL